MGDLQQIQRKKYWNEAIETMPEDQMRALQWKKLKPQVDYNYKHSPFYQHQMDEAGIHPEDIRTWDDFEQIPMIDKSILREVQRQSLEEHGNPYHLISCCGREKIVRITATSGTTGTPTLYTYTRNDTRNQLELTSRMLWRMGIRPGDVVVHAKALSMFGGGFPSLFCTQEFGAAIVPVGAEGGSRRILQFTRLTKANVLSASPSLLEYLIDKCPEHLGCEVGDLGLKRLIGGTEPGGGIPAVKQKIESAYGCPLMDRMGGVNPFCIVNCSDGVYRGLHWVSPDYCYLELLDPETKQPIPITNRAVGTNVVTWLGYEGTPLMRYSVGDVVEVDTDPCPCGDSGIRFHIRGRGDDMLIVKGANVYPSGIKNALLQFAPRITGFFKVILDAPGPRVNPPLQLEVEYGKDVSASELPALSEQIVRYMHDVLRVSPAITWLPPGSIELGSTQKAKYIEVRS